MKPKTLALAVALVIFSTPFGYAQQIQLDGTPRLGTPSERERAGTAIIQQAQNHRLETLAAYQDFKREFPLHFPPVLLGRNVATLMVSGPLLGEVNLELQTEGWPITQDIQADFQKLSLQKRQGIERASNAKVRAELEALTKVILDAKEITPEVAYRATKLAMKVNTIIKVLSGTTLSQQLDEDTSKLLHLFETKLLHLADSGNAKRVTPASPWQNDSHIPNGTESIDVHQRAD